LVSAIVAANITAMITGVVATINVDWGAIEKGTATNTKTAPVVDVNS
jgi:hypothetical protein